MVNTPEKELSTTLLCFPAVAPPPLESTKPSDFAAAHDRFVALSNLISKSVLLFGCDALVGLVFFHPLYDRDAVVPKNDASYGTIR